MVNLRRLFFVSCLGIFFLPCHSMAQEIKYSLGPPCIKNTVTCLDNNEIPTCLDLNLKVHLDTISSVTGEKINRYQPSCGIYPDNLLPFCIDTTQESELPAKNVVLECIEFIKCQKQGDQLVPNCSEGKVARCLGDVNPPSCTSENLCKNGSIPICEHEHIWQASTRGFSYK